MIEPLYVAARSVPLDALDAVGEQHGALILADAQAVYIHTGAADLAVAEFTTDGELVLVRATPAAHQKDARTMR